MTRGQKILLVEDDEALRTSLSEQLNLHGEFETMGFQHGELPPLDPLDVG